MVTAYMEEMQRQGSIDPLHFINYLSSIYDDPNKKEKAMNELSALRQGKNISFSRFLPLFERLLAESGGLSWPDENKINALKMALSPDLRDAFASVKPPNTYDLFVSELTGLASRKEAAKAMTSTWQSRTSRNAAGTSNNTSTSRSTALTNPNAMDWEPSVNAAAIEEENKALRGKRAKWVSKQEIQKRRAEHRCLRCSRKGCSTKKCPLLPAVKPVAQASVNSANTAVVEELN